MTTVIANKSMNTSVRRPFAGAALPGCLCVLAILIAVQAHAAPLVTPAEMATLPNYCAESEASPTYERYGVRWKYWTARMGPTFNKIHHYCWGLVEMMRVRALHKGAGQEKMAGLRRAVGEYNFVIVGAIKPFPLMPEVLLKRAEAAVMMEDWSLAYASYSDAWKLKPDYWPAYLGWAEVLNKVGKRDDARAILLEGLSQSPTAEPLRRLYLQLGGAIKDIPEPRPAVAPVDETASSPAVAASGPAPASSAASAPQ